MSGRRSRSTYSPPINEVCENLTSRFQTITRVQAIKIRKRRPFPFILEQDGNMLRVMGVETEVDRLDPSFRQYINYVICRVDFSSEFSVEGGMKLDYFVSMRNAFKNVGKLVLYLSELERDAEPFGTMFVRLRLPSIHWGRHGLHFTGNGSTPPKLARLDEDSIFFNIRQSIANLKLDRLEVPNVSEAACSSMPSADVLTFLRHYGLFETRTIYLVKDLDTPIRIINSLDECNFLKDNRKYSLDGDDGKECIVCLDAPKQIIYQPCGHFCVCAKCAKQVHNKCPLCRQEVGALYLLRTESQQ